MAFLVVLAGCRKDGPHAGDRGKGRTAMRAIGAPTDITSAGKAKDLGAPSPLPQYVATFNTGLARNYVPYLSERRSATIEALKRVEAEAVCLQEVWEDEDAATIVSGLKDVFPHHFRVSTKPPSSNAEPSCTQNQLAPLSTCVEEHCRAADNVTECVMTRCGALFFALPGSCRNCLAANVSRPLPEILKKCTSGDASSWGYGGRNGLLLLVRNPFLATSDLRLDSFLLQRTVLHGKTRVLGGDLHLFCTHLSTPVAEVEYAGAHGSWKEEHAHQIELIIRFIKKTAGRRPAVLMGDLNCGPANAEWEVHAEFPEHFQRLLSAGLRSPYSLDHGHCTWCGIESLGARPGERKIIDHLLFANFGDEILLPERFLEERTTVTTASGKKLSVPLSDHYGVRVSMDLPFVAD